MHHVAPVWERLLTLCLGPPIMAILLKFLMSGWAFTVQGGKISETTKKRQAYEFWAVLAAMYAMAAVILVPSFFN